MKFLVNAGDQVTGFVEACFAGSGIVLKTPFQAVVLSVCRDSLTFAWHETWIENGVVSITTINDEESGVRVDGTYDLSFLPRKGEGAPMVISYEIPTVKVTKLLVSQGETKRILRGNFVED